MLARQARASKLRLASPKKANRMRDRGRFEDASASFRRSLLRTEETATTASNLRRWAVPIVVGGFFVAGAALGATQGDLEGWTKRLSDIAKESESLGPVYFGAAYSLATVLLIPASVLTLAAGYLFGPIKGTIVVSMSSTTGAALAFGLARTVLRPYVFRWLEAYPKFVAVDKAVSEEGARVVFLLRLSPLFPFGLSNYMFGLTSIDFISYIGASWIGMLPGTFLYVYLGSAGQAVQNVGLDGAQSGKIALYVVGLIATLLATKTVTSAASRALEESAREDS